MAASAAFYPPHPTDQDTTDATVGDTTAPAALTGDQDDAPDHNTLGAGKTST